MHQVCVATKTRKAEVGQWYRQSLGILMTSVLWSEVHLLNSLSLKADDTVRRAAYTTTDKSNRNVNGM